MMIVWGGVLSSSWQRSLSSCRKTKHSLQQSFSTIFHESFVTSASLLWALNEMIRLYFDKNTSMLVLMWTSGSSTAWNVYKQNVNEFFFRKPGASKIKRTKSFMIWLQSGLMNKRDNEGETWSRVTLQKTPLVILVIFCINCVLWTFPFRCNWSYLIGGGAYISDRRVKGL